VTQELRFTAVEYVGRIVRGCSGRVRKDRRLSDRLPALPPPDIPPEGRHAAGECLDVRRSVSDDQTLTPGANTATCQVS
jgi:hypothetical protein